MREIGIRELKRRASDVVREVATGAERYTVTKRGRPVGVLVHPDYLTMHAGARLVTLDAEQLSRTPNPVNL